MHNVRTTRIIGVLALKRSKSNLLCTIHLTLLHFRKVALVTQFHISFVLRIIFSGFEFSAVMLQFSTIHLLCFLIMNEFQSTIWFGFVSSTVFSAFFILNSIPINISKYFFYSFFHCCETNQMNEWMKCVHVADKNVRQKQNKQKIKITKK